jgi:hypothetical protein
VREKKECEMRNEKERKGKSGRKRGQRGKRQETRPK